MKIRVIATATLPPAVQEAAPKVTGSTPRISRRVQVRAKLSCE